MNGHRPCFIWAGLMPGLWTHWQGQINHTSFSLCLENIEERKNERAEGGWKTHSLLLDRLQFYSVPGAWYASHRKKHTTTMLRKKYIKRQTHYIERNQLLGAQVSQKKNPRTQNLQKVLWQFIYNGIRCWYMVPFRGICLVLQGILNTNIFGTCYFGCVEISNSFS